MQHYQNTNSEKLEKKFTFSNTSFFNHEFKLPNNISTLDRLSSEDKKLFFEYGFGSSITPRFPTILQGINHFIDLQPDAIAVEYANTKITYKGLNDCANRVANKLRLLGVKRGDAVCLYLQRSIPMVVGILAIMKLGAAYVPQHVGVAPEEGMRHIQNITGAKVILTLNKFIDEVPVENGLTLLAIDDLMEDENLDVELMLDKNEVLQPDDRCMILFTSGTTGVPNGVQVTHRNLCNILLTAPGDMGIRPGTRVGQILSIAFDMAAWEILGCLSNGGTLIIREKSIQETAEKVDVLIATPSILNSLDASRCTQIKRVAVAGEPCPRPLADLWGSFCDFYNSCGPTETTIINTAELHRPEKEMLTIGRPTPNNTVYILDEDLNPLPIGEKGEMWAGGDCVTAGYLANDTLNAERYRVDPFLGGGRMMFRTKDLGCWTDTGELVHWGRVDDMVKIRGFRVELDGVTNVLERCERCEQAVTLKYDNKTLVSFVTPTIVDVEKARNFAVEALPYYAVPQLVIALDALPRTDRGKIDKRELLKITKQHMQELV